jgi:hypothetical protein
MKNLFMLAAALALSACGSGSMIVNSPAAKAMRYQSVELVYDQSTVGVPDEAAAKMKQLMAERFFSEKAVFAQAPGGLIVHYGFIGYDPGSRFARWALGGLGGGKATMVVKARFTDGEGNQLAEITSTGELGMGVFGGTYESAMKKAANEIGTYAESHFR